MPYLTFLDYSKLEQDASKTKSQLENLALENEKLKQRGKSSEDRMAALEQKVEHLMNELMKSNNYIAGKNKGKKA
jgi:uncharacterized protein YhaN